MGTLFHRRLRILVWYRLNLEHLGVLFGMSVVQSAREEIICLEVHVDGFIVILGEPGFEVRNHLGCVVKGSMTLIYLEASRGGVVVD